MAALILAAVAAFEVILLCENIKATGVNIIVFPFDRKLFSIRAHFPCSFVV